MIGLQSVTATSDTFPSVLMGIPGTSGSQATVMDGFPMSKRGEAARALSAAFTSSMFGGLFGAAVLSIAIFFAEPLIMAIGLSEQLMLVVLALAMVGTLTGISPAKGMAACCIGLMIGAFGSAPGTGEVRLTFDTEYLLDPVKIVIMGLAMFAVPEIIELVRRGKTISETGKLGAGWLQGMRDWARNWGLSLRCSAIGCLVGALPGLGGTVIDWIAYSHAIQTTSNRESYGTGDVRGVIAPESATNSKEGGSLLPTLFFGVPGSSGMAILLGAWLILGIQPGPAMLTEHLDLVWILIWALVISNLAAVVILLFITRWVALLIFLRGGILIPVVLIVTVLGTLLAKGQPENLILLGILSVIGYGLLKYDWPRPPFAIGIVLGKIAEESLHKAWALWRWDFFVRPLSVILISLILATIAFAVYRGIVDNRKRSQANVDI
ncbi:MAG: tripartite tricarboxylate transporter permease [Alphaproteobacteria bacterium]|nr:tripartite tricarboxylate transporter permease [Alphaproteobacteria bacterium]